MFDILGNVDKLRFDVAGIEHYAFWQKSRGNPFVAKLADILEGLLAQEGRRRARR